MLANRHSGQAFKQLQRRVNPRLAGRGRFRRGLRLWYGRWRAWRFLRTAASMIGPRTAGAVGWVRKCAFPAVTPAVASAVLASLAGPARPRLVLHLLHHSSAP